MPNPLRTILGGALLAALSAGCGNTPPGAGFTNGAPPVAEEKPSLRDDLRDPDAKPGNAALADSAASSPAKPGNEGGTGGRNIAPADARSGAVGTEVTGTPNTIEQPAQAGAQGGTKPPENINTGTPRSPH